MATARSGFVSTTSIPRWARNDSAIIGIRLELPTKMARRGAGTFSASAEPFGTIDHVQSGTDQRLTSSRELDSPDGNPGPMHSARYGDLPGLKSGQLALELFSLVDKPQQEVVVLVGIFVASDSHVVLRENVGHGLVPLEATKFGGTVRHDGLRAVRCQLDHGHVDRATSQVIDKHGVHGPAIDAVGQRRCNRLSDQDI